MPRPKKPTPEQVEAHAADAAGLLWALISVAKESGPGLSLREVTLLLLLYADKIAPEIRACSQALAVSRHVIARSVVSLETEQLIERRPGLHDKRNIRLALTAAGATLARQFVEAVRRQPGSLRHVEAAFEAITETVGRMSRQIVRAPSGMDVAKMRQ